MKVTLVSTYDLGRQPFGLASPAAWLREAGAEVTCVDQSRQPIPLESIRHADLIAFHLPMHTATRKALALLPEIKAVNPQASLGFYGLYAAINAEYLHSFGADLILGGEFEEGLVQWFRRRKEAAPYAVELKPDRGRISLGRQQFAVPDRTTLPSLSHYSRLRLPNGEERIVGYTEASRGCKHLCRHCPVVSVYGGQFRIVQSDVVLADITNQVEQGARHITFGDPDFFNGIGHAKRVIRLLHERHPEITYDVTIKIEHLLQHVDACALLKETGCLLVTSAVESIDDRVLKLLDKGHTRQDFLRVLRQLMTVGLTLNPTFIPFTPWISIEGYRDLLRFIGDENLIGHVAPIQLTMRLLIPAGSRLMELPDIRQCTGPFQQQALTYPWTHANAGVDKLQADLLKLVYDSERRALGRAEIFSKIWRLAHASTHPVSSYATPRAARATIPYLTEPWYC